MATPTIDSATTAFFQWLDQVLAEPISSVTAGYVLNLYEGVSTFDAQLAGTRRFDPADRNWAGDMTFSTGENLFSIDRSLANDSWERALELFTMFLRDYLQSGREAATLLRATAVAVGFVDGDLIVLRGDQN